MHTYAIIDEGLPILLLIKYYTTFKFNCKTSIDGWL